jgi:hypothetical protein
MPLSLGDVLNTLADPVTKAMSFWVGPVHISGESYGVIRDHIRVENILVVGGTETLAFYNSHTDILTTQVGTPPANLDQRALLLHECTHALVDVFADSSVTRHMDELASYIAQHVYLVRSDPSWSPGSGGGPWPDFFLAVYNLIVAQGLNTVSGNGKHIDVVTLEPLRLQLAGLPDVNYGKFKKEDKSGANGLKRFHLVFESHEEVSMRSSSVAYESWIDPSDDFLSDVFLERYSSTNVRGYSGRIKRLRREFAKCSQGRARELAIRFAGRKKGDRLSELFHDRLATYERNILLAVLRSR